MALEGLSGACAALRQATAFLKFYSHSKADQRNAEEVQHIDQTIFSNLYAAQAPRGQFPTCLTPDQSFQHVTGIQLVTRLTSGDDIPAEQAREYITATTEQFFQGMKVADPIVRHAFLTAPFSGLESAAVGQGTRPLKTTFLLHLGAQVGIVPEEGGKKKQTADRNAVLQVVERFGFVMEGKDVYAATVETTNRFGDPEVRHWFPMYCPWERWGDRDSILVMAWCLWGKFVASDAFVTDVEAVAAHGTALLLVEHVGQDRIWGDGRTGEGFNRLGKLITLVVWASRSGGYDVHRWLTELADDLDARGPVSVFLMEPNNVTAPGLYNAVEETVE